MTSAAFYRREAERCRDMAAATHDQQVAVRWRRIAKDYDALGAALAMEEQKESVALVARMPMQQQPIQQQQSKSEPEDKN